MFASRRALFGAVLTASSAVALIVGGCGLFTAVDRDLIPQEGGGGGSGGSGGSSTGECASPSDCPGSDVTCSFRTCEQATCGVSFAAAASACSEDGGNVCDGDGACVQCLQDEDCEPFHTCNTAQNLCDAGPCANGVMDGEETDVDCGGSECEGCANGEICALFTDCASRRCVAEACEPCADDVDCQLVDYCVADSCIEKKDNAADCAEGRECKSGNCADDFCCDNKCQLDCQSCKMPGEEGTCVLIDADTDPEGDCAPGVCGGGAACSCSDGVQNGEETGVDCGGSVCPSC